MRNVTMNNKPNLLIISCVDPNREPRLWRQLEFLRDDYTVTVIGTSVPQIDKVNFVKIIKLSKINKFLMFFCLLSGNLSFMPRMLRLNNIIKYDIVICHDIGGLGVSFAVAQKAPIIFDAHEYYPKQREDSIVWRLVFSKLIMYICKKYMPRCAAVVTVGENIMNEYKKNIPDAFFAVVRNTPDYKDISPSITQDSIKIIHHGLASKNRNLELMIDMVKFLDSRFTLTLMLVGSGNYYNKLKERALSTPGIIWKQPVSMNEIVYKCNDYDIGIFVVPPNTYNLLNCLPNKFFEYIQARLAIAIGPSPEMSKIVNEFNIGIISKDFTAYSMAQSLNKLTKEDVYLFKKNTDIAARVINAENEMLVYKNLLRKILV